MKFTTTLGLALPMAAAAKVSYDGFQAYHIKTTDFDSVKSALDELHTVSLECGAKHDGFDIAIAPESVEAFKKLDLDATLVHEDLGADLTKEGSFKPYKGMSPPSGAMAWTAEC
jgi:hypothetical protein